MVDVFISYSRTDLAAVTRLAQAVEAEGYDVWWDADLPPHLSYGDVIANKIGACKAAIVVWSKESAASEWVRAEADMARNQKKLVQTALANVMPPLPFNQIQFAEIGDWQGEPDHPGWRKVKASLTELVGPPRQAAPAATTAPVTAPTVTATAPAAQPVASTPAPMPPSRSSQPPATQQSSRKIIYGGVAAIGAVAVLGLGVVLGRGTSGDDPAPANTEAAALVSPNTPAAPAPTPTTAASSAAASAVDDKDRHVTITNLSSQTLRELYASPVTSDNWEEDLLGSDVLAAGASIRANIDNGTTECMYDLKAVMADDREYIQNRVDVCSVSSWTIGDAGNSLD